MSQAETNFFNKYYLIAYKLDIWLNNKLNTSEICNKSDCYDCWKIRNNKSKCLECKAEAIGHCDDEEYTGHYCSKKCFDEIHYVHQIDRGHKFLLTKLD